MSIYEMEQELREIVETCSRLHEGGENYFDELDSLVKNDSELVSSFINYAVSEERTDNVIISGEIGTLARKYQDLGIISKHINILTVNGGIRKNGEIHYLSPEKVKGKAFLFVDDSFYSGSTAGKVKVAVEDLGGTIVRNYVFYDGNPEKRNDVRSLYRYYE